MLSQSCWIMVCYAEPVVVNHGVLCWAGWWLWITMCYAEPVVINHSVLCWASGYVVLCWVRGCESWCVMLSHWLWIMCYAEPMVVNHVVLCWARGCDSWCSYAEQVVVNHGVLYWAGWLWIIGWYAEPSGCESCVILSRVVVNQGELCWVSRCESGLSCWTSSCEWWCAMLSQWLWIMCYTESVGLIHGVLCCASGC
jgi:hypothetical protein